MAQNDIIRCSVVYGSDSGNQWANVLHFRQAQAFDDPFDEFDLFWKSRLKDALRGPMSQDCQILAYQLTNLSDPTEFVLTVAEENAIGEQATTYMPTFLAACISTYGATAGKTRQGRHYFSGIGVTLADDGNWTQEAFPWFAPIGLLLENSDPQDLGNWEFGIWSQKNKTFTASIQAILRARVARLSRRQLNLKLV